MSIAGNIYCFKQGKELFMNFKWNGNEKELIVEGEFGFLKVVNGGGITLCKSLDEQGESIPFDENTFIIFSAPSFLSLRHIEFCNGLRGTELVDSFFYKKSRISAVMKLIFILEENNVFVAKNKFFSSTYLSSSSIHESSVLKICNGEVIYTEFKHLYHITPDMVSYIKSSNNDFEFFCGNDTPLKIDNSRISICARNREFKHYKDQFIQNLKNEGFNVIEE